MSKEKVYILIRDFIKIFLVYLFFEIVWPDPALKDIDVTFQILMKNTVSRFLKFGLPAYVAVQVYFLFSKDKY